MAEQKEIICLANSRKFEPGRCIAGRDLTQSGPGSWVRPISARANEAVSKEERQYFDGSEPEVLDVITIPLLSKKPNIYQPENWLLNPNQYWEKTGRIDWDSLEAYTDNPPILWENGSDTIAGLKDRVSSADAAQLGCSLYLLHSPGLRLVVFAPGRDFGNSKRRVQARFVYQSVQYWLWVTDPIFEDNYLKGNDGEYSIGECYITVSLGEPHSDGFCYKFVAAIITPEGARA